MKFVNLGLEQNKGAISKLEETIGTKIQFQIQEMQENRNRALRKSIRLLKMKSYILTIPRMHFMVGLKGKDINSNTKWKVSVNLFVEQSYQYVVV